MLEGVVKFPPEFAQKYREKGYWKIAPSHRISPIGLPSTLTGPQSSMATRSSPIAIWTNVPLA